MHLSHSHLVFEPLLLLLDEKLFVRISQPLVAFEVAATAELMHLRLWRLREIQISVLLLASVLQNLIRRQLVGQLAKSVVVAGAEAALDEVTFLVCVLVQH